LATPQQGSRSLKSEISDWTVRNARSNSKFRIGNSGDSSNFKIFPAPMPHESSNVDALNLIYWASPRCPSLDAAPSFLPSTVTLLVFNRLLPSFDSAPLKVTTIPIFMVFRVQPDRINALGLPISAPQLTTLPVASSFTL